MRWLFSCVPIQKYIIFSKLHLKVRTFIPLYIEIVYRFVNVIPLSVTIQSNYLKTTRPVPDRSERAAVANCCKSIRLKTETQLMHFFFEFRSSHDWSGNNVERSKAKQMHSAGIPFSSKTIDVHHQENGKCLLTIIVIFFSSSSKYQTHCVHTFQSNSCEQHAALQRNERKTMVLGSHWEELLCCHAESSKATSKIPLKTFHRVTACHRHRSHQLVKSVNHCLLLI